MSKKDHTDQREPIATPVPPVAGASSSPGAGTGTVTGASASAAGSPSSACFRIIDGTPTWDYKSVYLVGFVTSGNVQTGYSLALCTGVFVSDNVLLTAAHCLPNSGQPVLRFSNVQNAIVDQTGLAAAIPALATFAGNDAQRGGTGFTPPLTGSQQDNDVALVVFPDGTASDWSPLATVTRPFGTSVTLVGYGKTQLNDTGTLTPAKISGTNTLYDIETAAGPWTVLYDPYLYFLRGSPTPGATGSSLTGHGDSGGPLFDGTTVIGSVISGYTDQNIGSAPSSYGLLSTAIGATALSIYFNVASPTITSLVSRLTTTATSHPHVNFEASPAAAVVATTSGNGAVAGAGSTGTLATAATATAPTAGSGSGTATPASASGCR